MSAKYEWAEFWQRRCKARERLEKARCDLKRNHLSSTHVAERGMYWLAWSDDEPHAKVIGP